MQYLVDMRLADSGRSTTPAEGLIFLEQYILPTLEQCQQLAGDQRIVAEDRSAAQSVWLSSSRLNRLWKLTRSSAASPCGRGC
jgi:hypothetical protein